jgi:hypothetical protein
MLPQENFVICTPGDCFWWLLRPILTRLLINSSDSKIQKFTTIKVSMKALREAESLMKKCPYISVVKRPQKYLWTMAKRY